MHQRVGMNQFQRDTDPVKIIRICAGQGTGCHAEQGAYSLAAAKGSVMHGMVQFLRFDGGGRQTGGQALFNSGLCACHPCHEGIV